MGNSTINEMVPFDINYKYNNSERAYWAETMKCNESYTEVISEINCFRFLSFKIENQ